MLSPEHELLALLEQHYNERFHCVSQLHNVDYIERPAEAFLALGEQELVPATLLTAV